MPFRKIAKSGGDFKIMWAVIFLEAFDKRVEIGGIFERESEMARVDFSVERDIVRRQMTDDLKVKETKSNAVIIEARAFGTEASVVEPLCKTEVVRRDRYMKDVHGNRTPGSSPRSAEVSKLNCSREVSVKTSVLYLNSSVTSSPSAMRTVRSGKLMPAAVAR